MKINPLTALVVCYVLIGQGLWPVAVAIVAFDLVFGEIELRPQDRKRP